MINIKLTKRLLTVAQLVDVRAIADVGCDHGKLDAYLFNNNLIDYAIVSDISEASLHKAISLLSSMKANYEYAVCDGIYPYSKAELVVICGMGGKEIIKILKDNKTDIKKFILGPQHDEVELKKYLVKHNYLITTDIIVSDNGKFYNIIKCEQSYKKHKISTEQMYFGTNSEGSDYGEYVRNRFDKVYNLLPYMPWHKSIKMRKQLKLLKKVIDKENIR